MISEKTKDNLIDALYGNKLYMIGICLVLSALLAASFAPVLAPHNPTEIENSHNHQSPVLIGDNGDEQTEFVDGEVQTVATSSQIDQNYLLGTDPNGRDILSRAIYGARTSLLVAITAVILSTIIGTSVGIVSGYYGGRTDTGLMRLVDIVLAFPSLLVALTLFGIIGPLTISIPDPLVVSGLVTDKPSSILFPGTVTIAISAVLWVWIARVARSEAINIRNKHYVSAAEITGMSDLKIMRKHVLPNCLTPIVVLATIQVASVIIIESSLSFLGFSGTNLSWGYDIAQGRDYLASSWWIATVPGIFIVSTVMGVNFVGDWLRDALDPEVREGGR